MGQILTFPGQSVTLHSGIGRLNYRVVLWDHIGAHSRLPPVNAAPSYGLREWRPHTDESPVITVNFNDGKVNPRDNDILRILRSVHPKHTVKRLASLLSIPLRTADSLIYNYFSHSRRRELAEKLLVEIDKRIQQHAKDRQALLQIIDDEDAMDHGLHQ